MILIKELIKIYENNKISFPDFSIGRGEFCLIKGRSGIGKTTLLEILAFLNRKSGGEYYFNDRNTDFISDLEKEHIRFKEISFISQKQNLISDYTVEENLILGAPFSNRDNRIYWLKRLGIVNLINKKVSKLSGGEVRRVCIALAFIRDTPIIFGDEILNDLDEASKKDVIDILKEAKLSGKTFIISTHSREMDFLSDKIINLDDRKVKVYKGGEFFKDSNNISYNQYKKKKLNYMFFLKEGFKNIKNGFSHYFLFSMICSLAFSSYFVFENQYSQFSFAFEKK